MYDEDRYDREQQRLDAYYSWYANLSQEREYDDDEPEPEEEEEEEDE